MNYVLKAAVRISNTTQLLAVPESIELMRSFCVMPRALKMGLWTDAEHSARRPILGCRLTCLKTVIWRFVFLFRHCRSWSEAVWCV